MGRIENPRLTNVQNVVIVRIAADVHECVGIDIGERGDVEIDIAFVGNRNDVIDHIARRIGARNDLVLATAPDNRDRFLLYDDQRVGEEVADLHG